MITHIHQTEKQHIRAFIIVLTLIILLPSIADAHSGRTDASGCHNNRKTGDYHCHNDGRSTIPNKSPTSVLRSEKDYARRWCELHDGQEPTLGDGTRPDCFTNSHVVEFDWGNGMKPYECIGQALHYAELTGKQPLCILIRKQSQSIDSFKKYVQRANPRHVEVKCMEPGGNISRCP